MRALASTLDRYALTTGDEVTVVFDGSAFHVGDVSIGIEFAPGGRGAGDDAIVAWVETDPDSAGITVVTSDAGLAARVRARGAGVMAAGRFRRRIEEVAGS
jgi:predicted RNA-binding protein with PIN domain